MKDERKPRDDDAPDLVWRFQARRSRDVCDQRCGFDAREVRRRSCAVLVFCVHHSDAVAVRQSIAGSARSGASARADMAAISHLRLDVAVFVDFGLDEYSPRGGRRNVAVVGLCRIDSAGQPVADVSVLRVAKLEGSFLAAAG